MEFNATFLISSISFIIFTIIMNKILYEPMSKIVEKRQAYLEQNATEASKNQNSVKEIIEDRNSKLKDARKASKENVAQEMSKTKQLKDDTVKTKKAELNKMVEQHKSKLEQEKISVSAELDSSAQGLSDTILSKLKGGYNV